MCIASSPGIDSISRGHFLYLLIRSNSSSYSVTSSGFNSNSSFFAMSTTFAVPSSTELLNPSKSFVRVGINFFQTPVNVDILNSSYESQVLLMTHRLVTPFQKVSNLLCLDPSEETSVMASIALRNAFLK